jgi:lipopolysaccharide heptosyltransferase I
MPEAKISWLINSEYAEIIESHPCLDEVIRFDRGCFRSKNLWRGAVREIFSLWGKLRGGRFDLVIDLQGLLRSGLMAAATGADVRLGLSDARELGGLFYTHRVQLKNTDVHAVDRYMRCLERLGINSKKNEERDFSLGVEAKASKEIEQLLAEAGVKENEKFVLVVPGARWESKRWAIEKFAEVIDGIRAEMSLGCVLVGANNERQLCERLARMCEPEPVNLAGQTSLVQLGALVNRGELVLGHDSGTIHLAVAMNKPLVCIVGPTDPKRTGPYGREDSIVRAEVECWPCRREACADNKCMKLISIEAVLGKIKSKKQKER